MPEIRAKSTLPRATQNWHKCHAGGKIRQRLYRDAMKTLSILPATTAHAIMPTPSQRTIIFHMYWTLRLSMDKSALFNYIWADNWLAWATMLLMTPGAPLLDGAIKSTARLYHLLLSRRQYNNTNNESHHILSSRRASSRYRMATIPPTENPTTRHETYMIEIEIYKSESMSRNTRLRRSRSHDH
jgi:hypothetical protein